MPTATVTGPDGTSSVLNSPSKVITDANGNQISYTPTGTGTTGYFTDYTGNKALSVAGLNTSAPTYSYNDQAGTTRNIAVTTTSYVIRTAFGCSNLIGVIGEYNTGTSQLPLVTAITMPDGSSYQFTYEVTPGFPADRTGRLATVTLPTGGVITYTYNGVNHGINCQDGGTSGFTEQTPDGTWTFTRTIQANGQVQTVVLTPSGQTVTYLFMKSPQLEVSRTYAESGGTVTGTVVTCYNGNVTMSTCANAISIPTITPTEITAFTQMFNSSGRVSEVDTTYSSVSLPTLVKKYDFGSGAPGALLEQATLAYGSYNGSSCTVLGNHIIKPCSVQVVDEPSGNTKSLTYYSYDQTTPTVLSGTTQHVSVTGSRGNLQKVQTAIGNGSFLTTTTTNYDTGAVQTVTDTNGAQTTYNYPNPTSTCGNRFPASVSMPLSLSTSASWDCNGGVPTSALDPNNNPVSQQNGDPFWRQTSFTDQTNAQTTLSYSPTSQESVLSVSTSASVDTLSTLDSLGRPLIGQVRQQPSPYGNFDTVSRRFDSNGRPYSQSLPCVSTSGTACSPSTASQTYDAMNRPLVFTDPGTGTITNAYSNNDVQATVGPAPTKSRQYEYDGLGRLKSVCEITSASGSGTCAQVNSKVGFWTKYAYDTTVISSVTYNRVIVTQNAQSGTTQTRTFLKDLLGRLASETNPESGTTQYAYDSVPAACFVFGDNQTGNLLGKTDANGNTSCYHYDALRRLADIGATGPNAITCKRFRYDATTNGVNGSAPSGVTVNNIKNRLMEAETDNCGAWPPTPITDEWFSYSARGDVSTVFEDTPHSGGYYNVAASYWPNGLVNTLSATGLSTISYSTLDGEARPKTVSSAGAGGGVINFVQVKAATATSGSSLAIAMSAAQTAGNLNVVAVMWGDITSTVSSVTDSKGNIYALAVGPTRSSPLSSAIYYAKNIVAGSNTVTVTFNQTASFPNVNVTEYSGLDMTNPLDVTSSATGSGTTANSGSATTTASNELIVGVGNPTSVFTAAGSGFTSRIINSFGGISEDKVVSSAGSYNATATLTSGGWVMQMVAFRAASSGSGSINFVQVQSGLAGSASSVAITYPSMQTAGNLNVVAVMWGDITSTVSSVTDSKGNIYALAVGPTRSSPLSSAIYYAKNIAAGSNTVTVTFNQTASFPNINILEYSGLDQTSPLDVTASAVGSGTTANSGSATTTSANELIVGAGNPTSLFTAAGSGFSNRIINSDGGISEDKVVTSTGSYNATATLTSGGWVMQMAGFRAATSQSLVTSTSYNVSGQITNVTLGSGDTVTNGFDTNTGRQNLYSEAINGSTISGSLNWNPNGTLNSLTIADPFNATDAQTCNYTYDDLARLTTANCGTPWSQTFSYDAFGNLSKSGSSPWTPGYSSSTNRYTLAGTSYDANGNLLNDTFHTYTWNVENRPVTVDAIALTYDAFGRIVEKNNGGVYSQYLYDVSGNKFATMNGQSLSIGLVPLPGGIQAVFDPANSGYRIPDWLGSVRFASKSNRTYSSSLAFAPFGERYSSGGSAPSNYTFTGMINGSVTDEYDFPARSLQTTQGRWISPDPAGLDAVDPTNPQTWNRYAYVTNNPLLFTDPDGMQTGGSPCGPMQYGISGCNNSGNFPSLAGGFSSWDPLARVAFTSATIERNGESGPITYYLPFGTAPPSLAANNSCAGPNPPSPCAPANRGTPQQTARQQCLSKAYNTPEGKAVQFLSPVSLTPLNPNWKENWSEWGIALFGKGGGMFGSGIGTDTGIQTLNGVRNVGSWLENTTNSVLSVGEEVAPYAMSGMALADLLLQAQCSLDPSAPLEGIPIGPK